MAEKQMLKCRVLNQVQGVKRTANGQSVLRKTYQQGMVITAYLDNVSPVPGNYMEAYKSPDGFIIPKDALYVEQRLGTKTKKPMSNAAGDIPYATEVSDKDYRDKEKIKKVSSMLSASNGTMKIIDLTKKQSKTQVNASLIGAGLGLVYAMFNQKNKWMFASLGAVAGYVVATAYINTTKDDSKK